MKQIHDTLIRFIIGGLVLVFVYILSIFLPWPSLAGAFAAFPGVMATAVGLAGWRQDSPTAAEVAKGSVIGMLGCTVCVITNIILLQYLHFWWVALLISIIIWFIASWCIHWLFEHISLRRKS